MKLNLKLAELVGVIIGDGHIWKNESRSGFGITGDPIRDKKYFCYISSIIEKTWKRKPHISMRRGGLRLIFRSKEAFFYLTNELEMPWGHKKGENIIIPSKIINRGKPYIRACLRGIFDTDGSLFYANKKGVKKYPTIEISTISYNLANQLKNILLADGFRVKFRIQNRTKLGFRVRYILSLNGKREVALWTNKIGSNNPRHSLKMLSIK